MDFRALKAMAEGNNIKRNALRRYAEQAFVAPEDKLSYVCRVLLQECTFDYSSLTGLSELQEKRPFETQVFESEGKRYMISAWTDDNNAVETLDENNEVIGLDKEHRVYHFVHALKRGTCISFSAEVSWFASHFGLECERLNTSAWCYDGYKTVPEDQRIKKMSHYYNKVKIDGEWYVVDIAGALMALDYNKNNADNQIDPTKFMFIPEEEFKNQFEILANANNNDQC